MQKQIRITISEEMNKRIKEEAIRDIRTISMQVEHMIQEYFYNKNNKRKDK